MQGNLLMKPNEVMIPEEILHLTETEAYIKIKSTGNATVLFVRCDTFGEVLIHAGDGIFAGNDLLFEISDGEQGFVQLETGRYLITEGKYKGYIHLETTGDCHFCILEIG